MFLVEPGPLQVQQRCLLLENSESLDLPYQSDRLSLFHLLIFLFHYSHHVFYRILYGFSTHRDRLFLKIKIR